MTKLKAELLRRADPYIKRAVNSAAAALWALAKELDEQNKKKGYK